METGFCFAKKHITIFAATCLTSPQLYAPVGTLACQEYCTSGECAAKPITGIVG
jgi:hypothetical protein